jgi:Bifunctional DNA primase/polymerase, N-terminal
MFRIVSRSRRGATGSGYGWLLVGWGTLASIGGNVAHAHPNLVAQAIAAAIPLAVLAMLEGLKGDAGEVTRLAVQATAGDGAGTLDPAGQLPQATTVRHSDPTNQHPSTGTFHPLGTLVPHGVKDATCNRARILAWWTRHP